MSGEVYFDFKVKPSKKRDQQRNFDEENSDENTPTNRVMAVARELRRATANDRTELVCRSPEEIPSVNHPNQDGINVGSDNVDNSSYYHGLDRNVWKLTDYANAASLKEVPIARGMSPSWEDYVPYSSRRQVFPAGYKPRQKTANADVMTKKKHPRKKHSRRSHNVRDWNEISDITSPSDENMLQDEYTSSIRMKSRSSVSSDESSTSNDISKVNLNNTDDNHNSIENIISDPLSTPRSLAIKSKPHRKRKSKRHSHKKHRQRLANSATSEIEVDLGAVEDADNSLTNLEMEPYNKFEQSTTPITTPITPEQGNIQVTSPMAATATEPKLQCQAFYKNTMNSLPTLKEILFELFWWSILGIAFMMVMTYRSSLPPLNCNANSKIVSNAVPNIPQQPLPTPQ